MVVLWEENNQNVSSLATSDLLLGTEMDKGFKKISAGSLMSMSRMGLKDSPKELKNSIPKEVDNGDKESDRSTSYEG